MNFNDQVKESRLDVSGGGDEDLLTSKVTCLNEIMTGFQWGFVMFVDLEIV
jgi:hypothetical protein